MARAFIPQDAVRSTTGTGNFVADPGVALPNPATEGNGGLVVMQVGSVLSPPEQWHMAAQSGTSSSSPQMGIMCRADLPAGDQAWSFSALGGATTYWAWLAEEWTNLSYAPLLAGTNTPAVANVSSLSTGTTDTWDSGAFAVGIAVVSLLHGNPGGTAFSGISWAWSNGFTETDVVTLGSGTATSDIQMRVARYYGTAGETGPYETTVTFTGSTTNKNVFACLAVFRAEDQIETPAPSVMTA